MSDRYADNDDGTITDRFTGLMWQESDSYAQNGNYLSWYEAEDYVRELNRKRLGGYDDWRMPGRMEVQSIYELGKTFESRGRRYTLHIDPLFEFSYGSCFWTSRTRLSAALAFEFDVGDIRWYPRGSESASVRAVRLEMNQFKLLSFYNLKRKDDGNPKF